MRNSVINSNPTINGYEYGWSNVVCSLNNFPFSNILNIDYKESTTYENLYGKGSTPVARGSGNHEFEASITIRLSEVTALQTAARNQGFSTGDITCLQPFNITVAYIPSSLGEGIPIVDKLLTCQFKENVRAMAQGDVDIQVTIPIIVGGISWGSTQ